MMRRKLKENPFEKKLEELSRNKGKWGNFYSAEHCVLNEFRQVWHPSKVRRRII